jgi:hypothetical protein
LDPVVVEGGEVGLVDGVVGLQARQCHENIAGRVQAALAGLGDGGGREFGSDRRTRREEKDR